MGKYILNPKYGDMSVIILGSSLSAILKKLKKHWEDILEFPDEYDDKHIENINFILNKNYSSIEELQEDYRELIDEDYNFIETY